MFVQLVPFPAGGSTPDYGTYTAWDPDDKASSVTLSGSNLVATKDATTARSYLYGKHAKGSGKWHCQFVLTTAPASSQVTFGICGALFVRADVSQGSTDQSVGLFAGSAIHNAGIAFSHGATPTTGSVIDVYADVDAGIVWFAHNGTILNGSPSAGTGGVSCSAMRKGWVPAIDMHGPTCVVTANFGPTTNQIAGFQKWSNEPPTASKSVWRTMAYRIRSPGYFAHNWAECEVMASSGGSNQLSGATGTATLTVTSGSLAQGIDGNTATGVQIASNTLVADQLNGAVFYELAASATRNSTHFAFRAIAGGGGTGLQCPTLFDVWWSTGPASTGPFVKGTTITFASFADATPGTRKETTL